MHRPLLLTPITLTQTGVKVTERVKERGRDSEEKPMKKNKAGMR